MGSRAGLDPTEGPHPSAHTCRFRDPVVYFSAVKLRCKQGLEFEARPSR